MKKRSQLAFKKILFLTCISLTLVGLFQNCSPTKFTDLSNSELTSVSAEIQMTEKKIQPDYEKQKLNLIFIVDNSYSMTSSNLKIKESIEKLFLGPYRMVLDKLNLEIFLFSTAQNLTKKTSLEMNSNLLEFLITHQKRIEAGLGESEFQDLRKHPLSGQLPGDIIGLTAISTSNSAESSKTIEFIPASVLGYKVNADGRLELKPSLLKKSNQPVQEILSDLKSRLDVLNANSNLIDQASPLNDSLSEESGLCALSRILKNPNAYLKKSDLTAILVLTDEDDLYSSGKSCIQKIKYQTDPRPYVRGICRDSRTKINYRLNATRVEYQIKSIPLCEIQTSNQFSLKYKYKPLSWTVQYYTKKIIYRDNSPFEVIDPDLKTTLVPLNLTNRCNKNELVAFLPPLTVYDQPIQYPITCQPTIASLIPVEKFLSSDSLIKGKIGFNHPTLNLVQFNKSTMPRPNENCPDSLKKFLAEIDPSLKSKERSLDECKIEGLFFNEKPSKLAFSEVQNSLQCQTAVEECNSKIDQKCSSNYTPATPSGLSNKKTIFINQKNLACGTMCAQTDYCKSTPQSTLSEAIAANLRQTEIFNCQTFPSRSAILTLPKTSEYKGDFNCLSSCQGNDYCRSNPTLTVEENLLKEIKVELPLATLSSCETQVAHTDKSFGPALKDSPYCQVGSLVPSSLEPVPGPDLETIETLTGSQSLSDFIMSEFNRLPLESTPLYTFFVIKNEDPTTEAQTVGEHYIQLADQISGRSVSLLEPTYDIALEDLSDRINSRLVRTIQFSEVQNHQSILEVWLNGHLLKKGSEWRSDKNKVILSDQVIIRADDLLRIEYR